MPHARNRLRRACTITMISLLMTRTTSKRPIDLFAIYSSRSQLDYCARIMLQRYRTSLSLYCCARIRTIVFIQDCMCTLLRSCTSVTIRQIRSERRRELLIIEESIVLQLRQGSSERAGPRGVQHLGRSAVYSLLFERGSPEEVRESSDRRNDHHETGHRFLSIADVHAAVGAAAGEEKVSRTSPFLEIIP